ncbi:MAG TPA: Fic/DOC family N-terminal domain-containing protein [Rhodanobacteraceae bacterium]|nr:Fic/DOC family N-terminal domain-containing protein [Rhodanobacteraceae bacterium]
MRLEGQLQTLLSQADRALGHPDGSVQTLPNPALFVLMYVRKEAVLSSHHRLLEALFEHPIVSVADVRALLGTTCAGANQIVARLTALGVLREITGHSRHRRFRYEDYVRLFSEDEPLGEAVPA